MSVSLTKTAMGAVEYYVQYVDEGSERAGEWLGKGAEKLGLKGEVKAEILRNLFRGLHPDGKSELVRISAIRKDYERAPAWDLCVSAPKDVSLIAALFDDMKEKADNCQKEAAIATVKYIEERAAFVRRGAGGKRLEKAELIVAAFTHDTSRNDDPQKHTHLLIVNAAAHSEGFGTLVSEFLYQHQSDINAVYLATLGTALVRDLGVTLEPTKSKTYKPGEAFNIAGMSEQLRKLNSTRRAEILSARARLNITTAKGMEKATLATRRDKSHLPPDVLRPVWKKLAESVVGDLGEFKKAILTPPQPAERVRIKQRAVERDEPAGAGQAHKAGTDQRADETTQQSRARTENAQGNGQENVWPEAKSRPKMDESATKENAHQSRAQESAESRTDKQEGFSQRRNEEQRRERTERADNAGDQTRQNDEAKARAQRQANYDEARQEKLSSLEAILQAGVAAAVPDSILSTLVDRALQEHDRNNRPEKIGVINKRAAQARKALPDVLDMAEKMHPDKRHVIAKDDIKRGVSGKISSRAADEALVQVLSSTGAVACVDAKSGIETNQFVAALERQYRQSGFKVRTFSTTTSAVSELQTAIGKPVYSIGQLRMRLQSKPLTAARHHIYQILRAAAKKPTWGLWHFGGKSIVVVTDAQSIRTTDLRKILTEAKAGGSKVILVGSSEKRVRREPHSVFNEVTGKVGKVKLEDPVTHKQQWMADALRQSARNDLRGAFAEYAHAKRLHVAADQNAAMIELAKHWSTLSTKEQNGKALIVTDSDRDARVLNKLAQGSRRERGLPRILRQKVDKTWVRRGDRILFHIGSKHHGFRAGDLGTISRIGLKGMRIRLDRTRWALLARPPIYVDVPKHLYRGLSLGYAVSARQAQGMRCQTALVLPRAGGDSIRGLNTQLAVASDDARIFTSVRTIGEDVDAIRRSVERHEEIANKKQATESNRHQAEQKHQQHQHKEKEREDEHERRVKMRHSTKMPL